MNLTIEENAVPGVSTKSEISTRFLKDVLEGLKSNPKRLAAKYFYDGTGDRLFQKIMDCQEYYVTRCEAEIFKSHAAEIGVALKIDYEEFDLIELGAGDASKTIYLLHELKNLNASFRYIPIDISSAMVEYLQTELPKKVPDLEVFGLQGEYLETLQQVNEISQKSKVVLFLGSNIGNMDADEAICFLKGLRAKLSPGDRLLIGFDLKKHPATVLSAYNDASGFTKAFNLNLLERINKELGGNFNTMKFDHYPTYDPISGACKSYLVSNVKQQISIDDELFKFEEGEVIFMELSQKYDLKEINALASDCGFIPKKDFTDSKLWFADMIWQCI